MPKDTKLHNSMKHLLIVGARGWGREVYASAVQSKAFRNGEYDIKGFLDSKADALSDLQGNFPPIIRLNLIEFGSADNRREIGLKGG